MTSILNNIVDEFTSWRWPRKFTKFKVNEYTSNFPPFHFCEFLFAFQDKKDLPELLLKEKICLLMEQILFFKRRTPI